MLLIFRHRKSLNNVIQTNSKIEKGLRLIRLFWLEHQKHKPHKTQYLNNLTDFSSDMGNHRRDSERFTSPSNAHIPGNIYHYYYYDKQ